MSSNKWSVMGMVLLSAAAQGCAGADFEDAPDDGAVATVSEAVSLPHDQVPILPANLTAQHATWQPRLFEKTGCKAYAAVSAAGDWSGGLSPTGSESGSCGTTGKGQTYVRSQCWTKSNTSICAIMYTWYFPKDMAMLGSLAIPGGHRHDWENVIVWTAGGTFAGAAYSQHGNYQIVNKGSSTNRISGTTLFAQYDRNATSHAIEPTTSTTGVLHAGVTWENLPAAARTALAGDHWGTAAVFPLKDGSFLTYVARGVPGNLSTDYGFTSADVR